MKNKKQNEFKNVIILAIVVAILGIIYRAVSNLDFSHNQGNTAQENITVADKGNYNQVETHENKNNYVEIKEVKLDVTSQELIGLINSNWILKNQNYGESNGMFQNYEQYLNRGLKVRTISNKIYNIIFTKNYTGSVIRGINIGESIGSIESKLGTPSFKSDSLIGYKTAEFYVFFSNNEVSVYRTEDVEYGRFINLVENLSKSDMDLNEFLNELTYLWTDYSKFIVGENYFYISYPLKGISVKCNYNDVSAIILYNNCKMNKLELDKCLELQECLGQLQTDGIFEAEKERLDEESNIAKKCEEFVNNNKTPENPLTSNNYLIYANKDINGKIDRMYFISKREGFANKQLNDYVDTCIWLSDSIFLYSAPKRGIYYYILDTDQKGVLISGNEQYKIKSLSNGILKYDNTQVEVRF